MKADPVLQYARFPHHYLQCHMSKSNPEVLVLMLMKPLTPPESRAGREFHSAHPRILCL